MTPSEWADKHRVLVSESSAEPGQWRTSRAPYQREPMDVVANPDIRKVSLMTSAQVGKSEILNNICGHFICNDPAPMLFVQPTIEMAEDYSKLRIGPMIEASDALRNAVHKATSRDSGNTLRQKKFAGGHLTLSGANSPSSLASRPVRIVFGDERNKWSASAGAEGDPWELACKRTTTFHNYLHVDTSTPGVRDICPIERSFKDGDQRRYFVPCPTCGAFHLLEFSNLKWYDSAPETAHFVCPACESDIDERDKHRMLTGGEWRPEAETADHASFHLWEAYSPWRRWSQIAESFLIAKKTPETLQVWTNACLAETWEDRATSVEIRTAADRTEPYPAEVPGPVLLLTAGVDVQDTWLEAGIVGWTEHEEPYWIDEVKLPGSTSGQKVWDDLRELLLNRRFEHEDGHEMRIACTMMDTAGHRTQEAYRFIAPLQSSRVYGCVGRDGESRPLIMAPSKSRPADSRIPIQLHTYGTDTAKGIIYSRLALEPGELGRAHFPNREPFDERFFAGLTSEKCVIEYRMGKPKRVWRKKTSSARNEPLDCGGLALAALHKLRPNWSALKKRRSTGGEDEPKAHRPRRRQSWATGWRK